MKFGEVIEFFKLDKLFTYRDLERAYLKEIEKTSYVDKERYKNICLKFLYLMPRMITFNFKLSSLNKKEVENGISEIVKSVKTHKYYSNLKEDIERIIAEELDFYRKRNFSEIEVVRIFKSRMKNLLFGEYKRICLEAILETVLEYNNFSIMKNLEEFYFRSLYINQTSDFNKLYEEFVNNLNHVTLLDLPKEYEYKDNIEEISKSNNYEQEALEMEPDLLFINLQEKTLAISVLDSPRIKLVYFKFNNQIYEDDLTNLINKGYLPLKDFLLESECLCKQDFTYSGSYTILYKKENICLCHNNKNGFFVQEFYPSILFEEFQSDTVFDECQNIDKCLELVRIDLTNRINDNLKR